MRRIALVVAALAVVSAPAPALAWGGTGHRIVGNLAIRVLPSEVPGFLRTEAAARELGELSREPDRGKGSGKAHDSDRDPAHFIDLDEAGKVLGGPNMLPLAQSRADYETQLRAAGLDQWDAGYLPYAIIDRWQQVVTDFAYWRVLKASEANPNWRANRAWFRQDRLRREALLLKDLGELGHFVGDGSQPLHVSVHYNGWGDYPNPNDYATTKLHGPFESELVQATVRQAAVEAKVAPLRICGCPIEQRVADYLSATSRQVIPFYEMEKAGGLAPGDPQGTAFAVERLAVGASELRDLTVEAWRASAYRSVGWKPVRVQDVLSGKANPYPALYGVD